MKKLVKEVKKMIKTEVVKNLFKKEGLFLDDETLNILKREIISEIENGKSLVEVVQEKAKKLKRHFFN